MAESTTCPRGHRFDDPSGTGPQPTHCPRCAAEGLTPLPADSVPDPSSRVFLAEPLSGPSTAPLPPSPAVRWPTVPGYEVVRLLGRGGMGAVFLANDLRLGRPVAIKVIRDVDGGGSEERLRFLAEARAAARLQHPGVVQIHEVGEHDGAPYLILEYVEGRSLADLLAGELPTPRTAAELVAALADAMAYAHGRSVIHRDLKPANVLLGNTVCKVSDFGLAKLLGTDSTQTRTGVVVGTPSYMAPEQAAGRNEQVGPAADVYALGAILYECLTGRPPFRAPTVLETLDLLRHTEPLAPRQLQPGVPRDLETICLKCLQKEVSRRYPSADALADDLRRFLRGEPVRARSIGAAGRLLRWCRRRPLVAGLGVAVLMTAGLGAVGIGWQWRRARDQATRADDFAGRARRTIDDLFTRVSEEALLHEPGMQPLRRELLGRAVEHYWDFLAAAGEQPGLRAEVARARLARLTGEIGPREEAIELLRRAAETLVPLANESEEAAVELVWTRTHLGRHLAVAGKPDEALPELSAACELAAQLLATRPDDLVRVNLRTGALNDLALLHGEARRLEEALALHEEARALRERLHREKPEDPEYASRLAASWLNLGNLRQLSAGGGPEALRCYTAARELLEPLTRTYPRRDRFRHELAIVLANRSVLLLRSLKVVEALAERRRSLELMEQLAEANPAVRDYRRTLAVGHGGLGQLLTGMDRPAEARRHLERAGVLFNELLGGGAEPALCRSAANACAALGRLCRKQGDRTAAEAAYRSAVRHAEAAQTAGDAAAGSQVKVFQEELAQFLREGVKPAPPPGGSP